MINVRELLEILMGVLSDRALLLLTLILNSALYGYAIYQPSTERICIAAIFSALIFIPILRTERRNAYGKQTRSEETGPDREAA